MKTISRLFAVMLLSSASAFAVADPIQVEFDTFANLPGATFGGSGIPTNPTAITNFGTLTLGLSATQRFVGPNLGNDGAGTYFADPSTTGTTASWNFNYYINDSQLALTANGLTYRLLYDFNPGVNTDQSQLGIIDFSASGGVSGQTFQNSQNLGFNFLKGIPPLAFITPPPGIFNPAINGQYSFALIALRGGIEVARSAIQVNVGEVPEPGVFALLGLGMTGLIVARRRKQAK